MSNFNDFDLDVKQVKGSGQARGRLSDAILSYITGKSVDYSVKTIAENCLGTSDVPTTGYSTACCHKAKDSNTAEPKCI